MVRSGGCGGCGGCSGCGSGGGSFGDGGGRAVARLVVRLRTFIPLRDSGNGCAALQLSHQRQQQQRKQQDTAAATTEGPEATARATNHDGPARGDPLAVDWRRDAMRRERENPPLDVMSA